MVRKRSPSFMFNTVLYKGTTSKRHSTKEITINEAGNPRQISWYWWWQREYEIRERIPMATVNWLISIFSTGGYYYLEPRTLQVLFCQCVLNDPDKLGYFLKRKVPNRTPPKPEFRASCSWVLFGRGTFELAWIWFIQNMKSSRHLNTTSRLEWDRLTLAN